MKPILSVTVAAVFISSIHVIAQGEVQSVAPALLVSGEAIRAVIAREPIRAQTAQQDPKPPIDTRVRITATTDGHQIVGTIVTVDERTVTVRPDHGSVVTVPRSAIAKLERSNGRRSRGRGAALGLLIGGGGGAGVGFLIGNNRKCPPFFSAPGTPATGPCFLEPEASTLAGLIFAGGGGALIGALAAGDRWVVMPVDWLSGR